MAMNFSRRILHSINDGIINSNHSSIYIDRHVIEKLGKHMNRIVKYCQIPKMNLKNSPPFMLDILPDLYQILKEILINYEERLHILNNIEYFRIFITNLNELCTKTIDCFKYAGQLIYDEQSSYRKDFVKYSLYFSHNLIELKSLFNQGIYQGEKFRLTKDEAKHFWKNNFNERTIVSWDEFKETLESVQSILTPDEMIALKNMIDLTNNNHISIFEFDVFTRLFHPWSSLLTNWRLLTINHPGFMAFMTYDEVKAILSKCIDKPGSYLFRLSCTRLGQWAIGYVTRQNTILQTIPQTKPLIQSLIDGEREGYYKYPIGKNIHIDLTSTLKPIETNRIDVSEEQYSIYSNMDTSFELCKICSINNKNSKIQPCGHLLCQNCLISWQNQNSSKPPPLCPFCRSEIKGFESIIIKPFDNSIKIFPTRVINNENSSSDILPPPIPPRPVNIHRRLEEILPPPLHHNDILSNETLNDLYVTENETKDDIRIRLKSEFNFDETRIEAALILTDGLSLSKQYEISKIFLNQVKYEQEQLFKDHLHM